MRPDCRPHRRGCRQRRESVPIAAAKARGTEAARGAVRVVGTARCVIEGYSVLVTCEHGGNRVPPKYRHLFADQRALLQTHRGWDPGALALAREMAAAFDAPLFAATTTRLLIDLNRSIGTPHLYSEFTKTLPRDERRQIVAQHYAPHLDPIEQWVREAVGRGRRVLHIASHSFTPELGGRVRTADVGFLYDPRRDGEVVFSGRWIEALRRIRPDLRLRRNYPYLGRSDGLTFRLRRQHPATAYVGIELEVNQQFVADGGRAWPALRAALIASLRKTVWGDDGASGASPTLPGAPAPIGP